MKNCRLALVSISTSKRIHRDLGISVRYLASFAKSRDIPTNLLFLSTPIGTFQQKARLTKGQMARMLVFLKEKAVTHLGFSLMTGHFRAFREVVLYLRQQGWKGCIIAGGVHPTVRPDESLCEGVNYVVVGPGEMSLVDIVENKDPASISGLVYRRDGTIIRNPIGEAAYIDPGRLPFPDYDFEDHYFIRDDATLPVDASLYRKLWPESGTLYYLTTGRGCPYQCNYCGNVMFRQHMMRSSVARVMEELHWAKAKMPFLRRCNVLDDSFFMGSDEWLREFCTRYKAELGWPFSAQIMPRFCTRERLLILKEGGLKYATIGLQGSERMNREFYGRKETNDSFVNACNIMADLGIFYTVDVIRDVLYETEDDLREVAQTLNRLRRPFKVQVFSMTPFPGTTFYDRVVADGLLGRFGADAYESVALATRPEAYQTPSYWRKLSETIIAVYGNQTVDRLIEAGPADAAATAEVDRLYRRVSWRFGFAERLRNKAPRLFKSVLDLYVWWNRWRAR